MRRLEQHAQQISIEANGFKRSYRISTRFTLKQRLRVALGLPVVIDGEFETGAHCFPAPVGQTMLTTFAVVIGGNSSKNKEKSSAN